MKTAAGVPGSPVGAAAAASGPAAPEVAARDAVIGWFRGEFAAANAMIDALYGHLAQIGGGAEYEPVFAALQRRRLNWFPVLHMQKFYPVADVTAELRRIAEARAAGSCCYSEEAASTVIHEPVDDLPADPEPQPEPEPEQDPIQQDVAPVAEEPGAAAVNHAADHQVPDAEVDSSGDSSERKAASTTEDDNVDDDGRKYNHHLPLIHSSRALVSYCLPCTRICRTRSSLSLPRRRTVGDNHHDSISLLCVLFLFQI
jgi:mRNA N6-methyladenine demethylase